MSREDQDRWALRSHQRAAQAWAALWWLLRAQRSWSSRLMPKRSATLPPAKPLPIQVEYPSGLHSVRVRSGWRRIL
nr:hypothetical protein [Thermus scotoductus]